MFLSETLTAPDDGALRILAAADPGVLMEIRRPDVPLAIWQRPPPEPTGLQALQRDLSTRPAVDETRVQAVREALASGSYRIDPEAIASRMLELDSQLAG